MNAESRRARRAVTISVGVVALLAVAVVAVFVLRPDSRRSVEWGLADKATTPEPLGTATSPLDETNGSGDEANPDPAPAPTGQSVDEPVDDTVGHSDPAAGYVRLAVAGDVGTGGPEAFATAAAMDRLEGDDEYDALLLLGDNVYEDGDPSRVPDVVFAPFAGVLDGETQLLPVLGNHDNDSGFGDEQAEALGMPGRWYSTYIDDVLIISLDSNRVDDPDQLAWLTGELASSAATWTIVSMHHPPYSGGFHGSSLSVRNTFTPLFEEYGVQLVLAGHDHDYQRSTVINGVTYIVSGAAARLRDAHRADFTKVAFSEYSFVDLTVWSDHMQVQSVDQNGDVLDEVSIACQNASPDDI